MGAISPHPKLSSCCSAALAICRVGIACFGRVAFMLLRRSHLMAELALGRRVIDSFAVAEHGVGEHPFEDRPTLFGRVHLFAELVFSAESILLPNQTFRRDRFNCLSLFCWLLIAHTFDAY